ncbi:hypothetical protein BH10BAC3_BH10BAC3_27840 [soil metagenome]
MKEFSPEDLLEFHYNELSPEQSLELEQELKKNWPLRQKLEVIQEAAERLDKSIEKPRPQVLNSILQYAGRQQKVTL